MSRFAYTIIQFLVVIILIVLVFRGMTYLYENYPDLFGIITVWLKKIRGVE